MNDTDVSALGELFKRFSGKSFLFVKPGGNWGDQIIYLGAEYLAKTLDLKYRSESYGMFDPSSISEDEVVYLHGGGGFNPWCSGNAASSFTNAVYSKAKIIIQGPQSFDNEKNYVSNFLNSLDNDILRSKEVYLFVREKFSFDLLESLLPKTIKLILDRDTALHLTRDELLTYAGDVKPKYHLLALREDNEAPIDDVYVNSKGRVILDPAHYSSSFEQWVKIHAAAKSIVTNRTHSSVAGSILEIPTTLLAGSYHKNRSIWEAFLKDRGVVWGEYSLPKSKEKKIKLLSIPKILKESWKFKHLMGWIKGVP